MKIILFKLEEEAPTDDLSKLNNQTGFPREDQEVSLYKTSIQGVKYGD